MAFHSRSILKKSIASAIVSALIALSPGIGAYEALASNFVGAASKGAAAVPGGTGVAGVGGIKATSLTGNVSLVPASIRLQTTTPSVQTLTPSILPSEARSASVAGVSGAQASAVAGADAAASVQAATKLNAMQPTGGGAEGAQAEEGGFSQDKKTGAMKMRSLLESRKAFSLSAEQAGNMSVSEAHSAGVGMMDRILGRNSVKRSGLGAAASVRGKILAPVRRSGLSAARTKHSSDIPGVPSAAGFGNSGGNNTPAGQGGKFVGFIKSAATMAVGAGAAWGIHAAAVALAPALFGTLPIAAVWAVSSGLLILPIALFSRYRLGLRDSTRLKGVKIFTDLAIGAYLGAVAVAVPVFFSGALIEGLSVGVPAVIGLTFAATAKNQNSDGVVGGWINAALVWASLNLLTPFVGVAVGALPITVGGVFGLMAIPVMTTIAFFLGRIIDSAETGARFSVPGSMQKIRFPSYTWVMTGVVFALLTGYNPVWTNAAFGAWMLLGSKKWFNYAFFGILGWSAITGFTAPLTFLAIAFLPERASMWTENLLSKLLPKGEAAPSTAGEPAFDPYKDAPEKWPKFRFWLKTGVIMTALAATGFVLAETVFGYASFFTNLGVASALSLLPLFFSKWLIKKTMQAEPMLEEQDPEIYGIMRELREKINAERAEKGKKPIPMPEMVNVPMPVPNAFATGITPFHAMVGVTMEMKDMTLNAERAREGIVRLLYSASPQSKAFVSYRRMIRGTLPQISESAGPQEVIQAIQDADAVKIKEIGTRALRGVMGHEFNHVMHYDMFLGAITGAIASGISFASYGVLWAAGHAEAFLRGLWVKVFGSKEKAAQEPRRGKPPVRGDVQGSVGDVTPEATPGPVKPELADPVTAAGGVAIVLGLAKIFAALWAPVMARLLQMASGRMREGHADEGGALLTQDPDALALGLGFLTTWRPRTTFTFSRPMLPRLAAMANVMTVNPLDQLYEAGALPDQARMVARKGRRSTKEDNWFFNLFLTHPDTGMRIERLHDMGAALQAQKAEEAAAKTASEDHDGADSAPASRPEGSLRSASDHDGVDPMSLDALYKPGIDDRLLELVEVMEGEIASSQSKFKKLGHLTWALEELLKSGGVVRYAGPYDPETGAPLPGMYNPSEKALYLSDMYYRADKRLQGAVMAGLLQQVYDHVNGRANNTQEALVRQIMARDAYLEGEDMVEIAETVDIGNATEVKLLEDVLQNRLWAASGLSTLERIFGDNVRINHLVVRGRDQLALLERELNDLEDQLRLYAKGLIREAAHENYTRQVMVLKEKIGIKKGNILVAKAQLSMAEAETADETELLTPLSVATKGASHRASGKIRATKKIVKSLRSAKVDSELKPVLDLIVKTVRESKDPAIRRLAYLETTIEKLLAEGGRIKFASPGEGAAAYFSPVTLDVVIGREFARTHPALIAALMAHELTHAADYFGVPQDEGAAWLQRPLTRETERNAFTNEAIFIGAFDPEEIATHLDVNNPMEQAAYELVFHARMKYVEGKTSLEAMISGAYRDLFGAHFSGLQSAAQFKSEIETSKLAKIDEAYLDLRERAELTRREFESGQASRRVQLESMEKALEYYESYITVYRRQIAQMELEAGQSGAQAAESLSSEGGASLTGKAGVRPKSFALFRKGE